MDKIEKHVIDFLTEANSESKNKGEKFDPEKHLQQALKKWKERMGDAAERPNRGVRAGRQDRNEDRPGRRSTDRKDDRPSREDREVQSAHPAKPETKGFFKKFVKGPKAADSESPSEGGKKKSSFRGKRK